MADIDKELKRIEQGDAWDEGDKVVQIKVKKPLDKVIPVRLLAEDWEKLRQEARGLGVGPTTLARMWLLERLHGYAILPQEIAKVRLFLENARSETVQVKEEHSKYAKGKRHRS